MRLLLAIAVFLALLTCGCRQQETSYRLPSTFTLTDIEKCHLLVKEGDSLAEVKQKCGVPMAEINLGQSKTELAYGSRNRRAWLIVIVQDGRTISKIRGKNGKHSSSVAGDWP